jgi:hypothetical protein
MSEILQPGAGVIFMKVGTHAREDLTAILDRKRREIDQAGYALWGYGGNTCHPFTMVQPFARDFEQRNGSIFLCMQRIESNHFAEPERATAFSSDGVTWEDIPDPINVLGSRYALAITDLQEEGFDLPLARTKVAIGNSAGRTGDRYIQGRVDKGCLELTDGPYDVDEPAERTVHIGLTARIAAPYAVLVR